MLRLCCLQRPLARSQNLSCTVALQYSRQNSSKTSPPSSGQASSSTRADAPTESSSLSPTSAEELLPIDPSWPAEIKQLLSDSAVATMLNAMPQEDQEAWLSAFLEGPQLQRGKIDPLAKLRQPWEYRNEAEVNAELTSAEEAVGVARKRQRYLNLKSQGLPEGVDPDEFERRLVVDGRKREMEWRYKMALEPDSVTPPAPTMDEQMSALETATQHMSPAEKERYIASTVVHGRAAFTAPRHPKTHGVPVAIIQFRSYLTHPLEQFVHFAAHTAAALGIPASGPIALPTKRTLWTVPKGPFAHKKRQENFERLIHKRAIKAWDSDMEVINRWVWFLRKHRMHEVGMRVTRWERMPIGVGQLLEGQWKSRSRVGDKAKKLADDIVGQEMSGRGEVHQFN